MLKNSRFVPGNVAPDIHTDFLAAFYEHVITLQSPNLKSTLLSEKKLLKSCVEQLETEFREIKGIKLMDTDYSPDMAHISGPSQFRELITMGTLNTVKSLGKSTRKGLLGQNPHSFVPTGVKRMDTKVNTSVQSISYTHMLKTVQRTLS
ncbi:unnamed protein product [Trichobilharzia regenti]|nr:unnamed protein product [Trichobilharzia regenti]